LHLSQGLAAAAAAKQRRLAAQLLRSTPVIDRAAERICICICAANAI
jgi:hypothetical protein